MNLKKIHQISGLIISIFIGLHLFNHFCCIFGTDKHIEIMNHLRYFYRNIIVETVLFFAIAIQIYSGLKLFKTKRKIADSFFEILHIWSGLYLAIFFVIHLSAILVGRLVLNLDTNFYFGVAGLNSFPFNLFFIPYYSLAILSFFTHLACIHAQKMKHHFLGLSPTKQAISILMLGFILTIFILYGLTNHFYGVKIPSEYNILIGK
jgi:hypothetical protein